MQILVSDTIREALLILVYMRPLLSLGYAMVTFVPMDPLIVFIMAIKDMSTLGLQF